MPSKSASSIIRTIENTYANMEIFQINMDLGASENAALFKKYVTEHQKHLRYLKEGRGSDSGDPDAAGSLNEFLEAKLKNNPKYNDKIIVAEISGQITDPDNEDYKYDNNAIDLTGVDFTGCRLVNLDVESSLEEAIFRDSFCKNLTFVKSRMKGVDFRGSVIKECNFLRYDELSASNLSSMQFSFANLDFIRDLDILKIKERSSEYAKAFSNEKKKIESEYQDKFKTDKEFLEAKHRNENGFIAYITSFFIDQDTLAEQKQEIEDLKKRNQLECKQDIDKAKEKLKKDFRIELPEYRMDPTYRPNQDRKTLSTPKKIVKVSLEDLKKYLNNKADMSFAEWVKKETKEKEPVIVVPSLRDLKIENMYFRGKDFSGVDFSDTTITDCNFSKANLTGSCFEGSNLQGVSFDSCNITDGNFIGATGESVLFNKAIMPRVQMQYCEIEKLEMNNACLYGADISGAKFDGASMKKIDLRRSDMQEVNLRYVDARYANMRMANIKKAVLDNAKLNNADLSNACLERISAEMSDFSEAVLKEVNAEFSNFMKAAMNNVKAMDANFTGAVLEEVQAQFADFRNSILEKANAKKAEFQNAILSDIKAHEINFYQAALEEANLERADIRDAVLKEAIATAANFTYACFKKIKANYAVLNRAILDKVDAAGADFSGALMNGTSAKGADFTSAIFIEVKAKSSDFTGSIFNNAIAMKAEFNNAILSDVRAFRLDLALASLKNAHLERADLTNAILQHVDATEANFFRACLEGVRASNIILNKAILDKVKAAGADFSEALMNNISAKIADFIGSVFIEVKAKSSDFTGSIFNNVIAMKAEFNDAILSDIKAHEINLYQAFLEKANLEGADLTNAILQCIQATEANLTGACLKEATLNGAVLNRAMLDNVDAAGADFLRAFMSYVSAKNANFIGANLSRITVIEGNFIDVKIDESTLLIKTSLQNTIGAETIKNLQEKQEVALSNKSRYGRCSNNSDGTNNRFQCQRIGAAVLSSISGGMVGGVIGCYYLSSWLGLPIAALSSVAVSGVTACFLGDKFLIMYRNSIEADYIDNKFGDRLAEVGVIACESGITSLESFNIKKAGAICVALVASSYLPGQMQVVLAGSAIAYTSHQGLTKVVDKCVKKLNNGCTPEEIYVDSASRFEVIAEKVKGWMPTYEKLICGACLAVFLPIATYFSTALLGLNISVTVTALVVSSPIGAVLGYLYEKEILSLIQKIPSFPVKTTILGEDKNSTPHEMVEISRVASDFVKVPSEKCINIVRPNPDQNTLNKFVNHKSIKPESIGRADINSKSEEKLSIKHR